MNVYFKKEALRNQIIHPETKKPIQWENIGADRGVKVVDDADKATFDLLEGLADKRRMGVTRISAEIYDTEKKNPSSRPAFPMQSVGPQLRILNRDETLPKSKQAAVAERAEAGKQILQQGQQNPDGCPGTPINIAAGPQDNRPRVFRPRARKQSEITVAKPATAEPLKA